MHVVYNKLAIDTAGRSPENNTAMAYHSVVEWRDKQESGGSQLITDDDEKMLKKCYMFLLMVRSSLEGYLPVTDIFRKSLSS